MTVVLVLDSLFDRLDVEEQAAAAHAATLVRWDGRTQTLADADAVLHVRTPVDAAMVALLRRCRAIGRFGTGLDTVDLDAARAAGMAVVGVRDYCVPELPAHTLALAFSLQRDLARFAAGASDPPSWQELAAGPPLPRRGCAAVVGLGEIGRRVAAALVALGYRVLAVTRHATAEARTLGAEVVDLDAALPRADLVFLHAALDDTTTRLIDAARLRLMRPDALLIDTARLGLLDEQAVAAALESGRLGGLALDARIPACSPLAALAEHPRLLVTPHVGWYSTESARDLRTRAVDAVLAAATGPDDKETPR